MDLSPILGPQGRASGLPSQANSGDFSAALNRDAPREVPKHPRENPSQEQASSTSARSASDALAATHDDEGLALDPLAVTDTHALSATASVEQVLSARVFGLHLRASGYLSEYRLASSDKEPSGPNGQAGTMQSGELQAVSPLLEANLTASTLRNAPEAAMGGTGGANVAIPEIGASASTEVDSVALPLRGASAWREITWRQRALRLITRTDGKHTVWLRDYGISTDEARKLAVNVARQLKGQGVALHNIIWNGHEVWSSVDVD